MNLFRDIASTVHKRPNCFLKPAVSACEK